MRSACRRRRSSGELFIVRDIGNFVPDPEGARGAGMSAAIEYAVGVLGVQKIVVCGHSGCGAIQALLAGTPTGVLPHLDAWMTTMQSSSLRDLPRRLHPDEIARLNALRQLDHLARYPVVAARVREGKLTLAAWFFDVATGELEQWSPEAQRFVA